LAIQRHLPPGAKIMLEIPSAPASTQNKVPRRVKQSFSAKLVRVTNGDHCKLLGLKFQRPLIPRTVKRKIASTV